MRKASERKEQRRRASKCEIVERAEMDGMRALRTSKEGWGSGKHQWTRMAIS